MSQCSTVGLNYYQIAKDLILLDPEKYSNYDNVVDFFLSSTLSSDQKKLTIYSLAHVYKDLNSRDTSFILGEGVKIIKSSGVFNEKNSKEYMNYIYSLYNKPMSSSKITSEITKELKNIGLSQKLIAYEDLSNMLDMLEQYMSNVNKDDDKAVLSALDYRNSVINKLKVLIVSQRGNEDPKIEDHKAFVINKLNDRVKGFNKVKYIPIDDNLNKLLGLDNVLITIDNKTFYDAVLSEDQKNYEYIDSDGNIQYIPREKVTKIFNARLSKIKGYNLNGIPTWKYMIKPVVIKSGFNFYSDDVVYTEDGTSTTLYKAYQVHNFIQEVLEKGGEIKIEAIPISEYADSRVERIKNLANTSKEYKGLDNRNHESEETDEQKKHLLKDPSNTIVTYSKLKASEHSFFLQGSINYMVNGEEKTYRFNMGNTNNLIFVHGNNKTETIDFTNPEHVRLFAETTFKANDYFKGTAMLSKSDIAEIVNQKKQYNDFKTEVEEVLSGPTDVTNIFNKFFNITSKRMEKRRTLLKDHQDLNKMLTVVTTVKIDEQGNEIEQKYSIPVRFTRRIKYKEGTNNTYTFVLNPSLPVGTIIKHDGKNYQEQEYVREVLGITDEIIWNNFFKQQDEEYNGAVNTNNFAIIFNNNKLWYKIIEPVIDIEDNIVYVSYFKDLISKLNSETKGKALSDLQRLFNFKLVSSKFTGKPELFANFSVSGNGKLQIEIRPYSKKNEGNERYDKYFNETNKHNFNFMIYEEIFKNYERLFDKDSDIINEILKEYPHLKLYNLDKEYDKFLNDVLSIEKDITEIKDPIKLFVKAIETSKEEISQKLIDYVINNIQERVKSGKIPQEFFDKYKEDFTFNGVFHPEVLLIAYDKDGNKLPNINYTPTSNKASDKKSVGNTTYVIDSSPKDLVVSVKRPQVMMAEEKTIVNTTKEIKEEPIVNYGLSKEQVEEPVKIEQKPKISRRSSSAKFSIDNNNINESKEERLETIKWLRDNLPQFGLVEGDLEDILDLTGISSNVLGAFKNKVIYLNSKISSKGVLYHEAFHGVFKHIFNDETRRNLLNSILNNNTYSSYFTESAIKTFAEERNLDITPDIKYKIAEEILADGFQKYMNTNKPSKVSIIQKLFDVLERILDLFINRPLTIDKAYRNIATGRYSKKILNSGVVTSDIAYSAIPGILKTELTINGEYEQTYVNYLSSAEQKELIDMVKGLIIIDEDMQDSKKTFDEKFDDATAKLLGDGTETNIGIYNINNLIRQNPSKKDEIIKTFGDKIENFRFILGSNLSEEYNPEESDEEWDNRGEISRNLLKKLVKIAYDKATIVDIETDIPSIEEFLQDRDNVTNGTSDAEDELDNADFTEQIGSSNPMDSYISELRRFLSTIRSDKVYRDLGVTFPKMINGDKLFPMLLKMSADKEPGDSIKGFKILAEQQLEDGNEDFARDVMAVYNRMNDITGMDSGEILANEQRYKIMVEALDVTEIRYIMHTVDLSKNIPAYIMVDKVVEEDIKVKRNEIVSDLLVMFKRKQNDPSYKAALKELMLFSDHVFRNDPSSPVIGLYGNKEQLTNLNKYTEKFNELYKKIGFNVPKSLIRFSLIAQAAFTSKLEDDLLSSKYYRHFYENKNLASQGSYLQFGAMQAIGAFYKSAFPNGGAPNPNMDRILDDTSNSGFMFNFSPSLRKAAVYMIKYDPNKLPSVIRNAENKPIYRYGKSNPVLRIAFDLRTKGLIGSLSEDEMIYETYLKDFINDNQWFSDFLNNKDTKQSAIAKEFLKNMYVNVYGGSQQKEGNKYMEGATYGHMDKRALILMNIASFLNRNIDVTDGRFKHEVQTFTRSLHQNESTSTNFLVPAIYTKMFKDDGDMQYGETSGEIKNEEGFLLITDDLYNVLRQEYNRIKREWARRNTLERNKSVKDYNATISPNGKIDRDSSKLRAYKFNVLSDLFEKDPKAKVMSEELIRRAKMGSDFDSFTDKEKRSIKVGLEEYAKSEFNKYIEEVIKAGVIERNDKGDLVNKMLPEELKVQNKRAVPIPYATMPGRQTSGQDPYGLLFDNFFNFWRNSLYVNQLFDGDISMSVKSHQDYVKRKKRDATSSPNMKDGFYTTSIMNTVYGFSHNKYPQYGFYTSLEEIENDKFLTDDAIKYEIRDAFLKAMDDLHNDRRSPETDMLQKVFDGQSYALLMHHMDQLDSVGRINDKIRDIIIAKHYRPLTKEEYKFLKAKKVVLNSKKTIGASRHTNDKLSESYIDRNDVSILIVPQELNSRERKAFIKDKYDELFSLYSQVYNIREAIQNNPADRELNYDRLKSIFKTIHSNFRPIPGREMIHDILNSMEYHQIDQLLDTEASKNVTILPVNLNEREDDYISFNFSSQIKQRRNKYFQVETSKVKDHAKVSVQKKMLVGADLEDILEIIRSNEIIDKELATNIKEEVDMLLENYEGSMTKVAKARFKYLTTVMRDKEGNFNINKIFKLIKESLEALGAKENLTKFFELDENGEPRFNPNLLAIRATLEYYFFAQYSKYATDEKANGFKNYLESAAFYKVIEDNITKKVIPVEKYKADPEKYPNITTRSLGVTTEIDENGNTTYYAECIIPKPEFNSVEEELFWKENISKMFGVRIPTEDKRSMVVLKVVDFIDSAKANTIIVPQYVHILAGSDFDIDSVYGQMFSYYKNMNNKYQKYGDYSNYDSEKIGKFMEFINFMSSKPEIKLLINKEKDKIKEQGLFINNNDPVYRALLYAGIDEDFLKSSLDISTEHENVKQIYQDLSDKYMSLYTINSKNINLALNVQELLSNANMLDAFNLMDTIAESANTSNINQLLDEIIKLSNIRDLTKESFVKITNLLNNAVFLKATFNVFHEMGIPTTAEKFEESTFGDMVVDAFQNENLQASMDIISNELVFNNLYINQKSSVEAIEEILKTFGINFKDLIHKGNLFTITNVILSKDESAIYKDAIGITASMNKFMGLSNQYKQILKPENVIWDFIQDGERVYRNSYGALTKEGKRVIELIGNILGMFADGMKNPIPAGLNLNLVNLPTYITMLGIGLDPEFVTAFNYIPEIANAASRVQESQFAIKEDPNAKSLYLASEIDSEISKLLPDTLSSVWSKNSAGPRVIYSLKKDRIKISFNPKALNIENLKNNKLTLSELGFEVSIKDPKPDEAYLSENEQKAILLQYYKEQTEQASKISKFAVISNMFKRLKPDFLELDKISEAFTTYSDPKSSLFTEDSITRLLDNQVYSVFIDIVDDLLEQSSKIFIDRSSSLKPLTGILNTYTKDVKGLATKLFSTLVLRSQVAYFPGTRKIEDIQDLVDKDDKNLVDTFTADYWFNNTLHEELAAMVAKYPDNLFLKSLRPEFSDFIVKKEISTNTQPVPVKMKYLKFPTNISTKGDLETDIVNDLLSLTVNYDDRLFIKKLFYHELARTGMGYKSGSFLRFFDPEFFVPLSDRSYELTEILNENLPLDELMERLVDYTENSISFEELLNKMLEVVLEDKDNKVPSVRNYPVRLTYKLKGEELETTLNDNNAILERIENVMRVTKSFERDKKDRRIFKGTLHGYYNFIYQVYDSLKFEFHDENLILASALLGNSAKVTKKGEVIFPPVFKTSVTDKETGRVSTNIYMIKDLVSLLKSSKTTEEIFNSIVGTKAQYIKVTPSKVNGILSSSGFSPDELNKFNSYIDGTMILGRKEELKQVKDKPIIINSLNTNNTKSNQSQSNINGINTSSRSTDTVPTRSTKGFQGYKGGFEDKGKGTPEGDGKDKAMREVADGFIGELINNGKESSTLTSAYQIARKIDNKVDKELIRFIAFSSNNGTIDENSINAKIVMLARNADKAKKPLSEDTKNAILSANTMGAEFVVGDMPGVDSQFIDYLKEIGAKFTIYHTGNKSRIIVNTETSPVITEETFNQYGTTYTFTLENGIITNATYRQGYGEELPMNKKNWYNKYEELKTIKQEVKPIPKIVESVAATPLNTFTFKDGTVIETGFKLNSQQEEALQLMADFYNDKSKRFFTLQGYAGTGKTTIVKFLVDYINEKSIYSNVVFSSPTHRANAVLKQSLRGQKVSTLQKIFGLSPEQDLDEFDTTKAKFIQQKDSVVSSGDTLIIDESSMINDDLFTFIINASKEKGIRVVFMGDPAQIKPVKQDTLSKAFSEVSDKYELTKVERTGDNPLLAEITHIRNTSDNEPFTLNTISNSNDEGVSFTNSPEESYQKAVELYKSMEFKNNPLLVRVISGTNTNVTATNEIIRKGIFGKAALNEYNEGDVIMGYDNFDMDYRTQESKIINSGDYIVTKTSELKTGNFAGVEVKYFNITLQDVINKDKNHVNIKMLSKTNSNEIFNAIGKKYEELRKYAASLPKGSKEAAQAWIALSSFKSEYATPVNISYGTYFDGSPAVKIKKTIDYGYAHTIHKSQGGTYKYVIVDSRDISKFPDKQLQKQLKYVALSRAQKHAYVLTNATFKTKMMNDIDEAHKCNM